MTILRHFAIENDWSIAEGKTISANELPRTVAEKYTFNASFVVGAVMDVDCLLTSLIDSKS